MQFLYGDSTPSPLTMDFVDLLRKSLDCFVPILQAEQRMALASARRRELEQKAEHDGGRLRELEGTLARAISAFVAGASPDAPVTKCSEAISRAAGAAVMATESEMQAALAAEVNRIEESTTRERTRCVKALEQLLLVHDLPGAESELRLEQKAGAHAARLHISTPYGLTAALELEIPATSWFAHTLRVSQVVETLDIQVPKTGGWIRKEGRLSTEKLGRLLVTGARLGVRSRRVSLRTETLDEGYDLVWGGEAGHVQVIRIASGAAPVEFDLVEADLKNVLAFTDKLAVAALQLGSHRKALAEVALDGEPLDKQRQPSLLVERLVEVMAPIVREIVTRSGSQNELVLRLLLGDGRREERFVPRAELLEKLAILPVTQRIMFAPFGLGEISGAPPPPEPSVEISAASIFDDSTSDRSEPSNGRGVRPPPIGSLP
jgi:hypothetical protein